MGNTNRQKLIKWVAILIALLLVSSCSTNRIPKTNTNLRISPAPYFDTKTGIYFPGSFSNLHRRSVVNFEDRNPGLGIAIGYRKSQDTLDIFVYDLRASVIPEGIDSDVVQKSFQEALSDMETAARKGGNASVRTTAPEQASFGNRIFLHAKTSYRDQFDTKESHLFVTGCNGQIIKVRATLSGNSELDLPQSLGHLANAMDQASRNGYGSISNKVYRQIDASLAKISLHDGMQENEAIAIAQITLVKEKRHNRYDPIKVRTIAPSDTFQNWAVRFEAYPTHPPRLEEQFIVYEVTPRGQAYLIFDSLTPADETTPVFTK